MKACWAIPGGLLGVEALMRPLYSSCEGPGGPMRHEVSVGIVLLVRGEAVLRVNSTEDQSSPVL